MFFKRIPRVFPGVVLVVFFLTATLPGWGANPRAGGSLSGYVFESDGATPSQRTVVVLKNLATKSLHRSEPTSSDGFYRIENLERGLYAFGAVSDRGDFAGRGIIGIEGNNEAKLSLSLKVQEEGKSSTRFTNEPPAIRDEKFLGRIVSYDPEKNRARIFVEQGEALLGETIHLVGRKDKDSDTDFYQTLRYIEQNGNPVDKAVAGQYYDIPLEKAVKPEDWLYVKEKEGMGIFLLTPIGMATVLASTTAIVYTVVNPPPEVSVYRH